MTVSDTYNQLSNLYSYNIIMSIRYIRIYLKEKISKTNKNL